jgi:hypothetical protein
MSSSRLTALGGALLLACQAPPAAAPSEAVYYVSLSGDDRYPGTAEQPWRHLEWAMTRPFLRGGDTIRVAGGIYRPDPQSSAGPDVRTDDALIRPVASGEAGRPIRIMAGPGETVVLSGRRLAEQWTPLGSGSVYYHDYAAPGGFPFDDPFQVAEDGRLLFPVLSPDALDAPGRCFVDPAARRIYVTTSDSRPPAAHVIEYGTVVSGIEFRNVSHWRLSGFALAGFRTSGMIIASQAGRIELHRMDVSYIGAHRPGSDPTSGYGLAVYDTSGGNRITESRFHHTFAEAVHVSQTGAGEDVYDRNELADAGGPEWFRQDHPGRYLTGPGMIVRSNRLIVRRNWFLRNGHHGLVLESDLFGAEGPSHPSGNLLEGNVFCSNAGNGVHLDGKNGLSPSAGNVLRFNLLCHNNQRRGEPEADAELRLAGKFHGTAIEHNTIYAERANAVLLTALRRAAGSAQGADGVPEGTRLLNNIAVHAATSSATHALRGYDAAARLRLDSNNWHRTSPGALVHWDGAAFETLEAFTARTGFERRGLSADPQFVSPQAGLFWLRAGSPLIGRALLDFDGAARFARGRLVPADLGAFPYGPAPDVTPTGRPLW